MFIDVIELTQAQVNTISRISTEVYRHSRPKLGGTALHCFKNQQFLTTGDGILDELMGGGAPVQHITEFVGESGVGKSQFMTQFCITTQLPVSLGGLNKEVVYISTESGLATSRARQISAGFLERYSDMDLVLPVRPLDRIHVVVCPDLELQDHIMYYQLPVLLKQRNGKVGSIIIDSIAANYRAELEGRNHAAGIDKRAGDMGMRTKELTRLSAHLRRLAVEFDLAVIVANQVSDRINGAQSSSVLSLDHQSQWFGGWKSEDPSPKLPALGLVWANAVHCRVALKKTDHLDTGESGRQMKLVYSPFAKAADIQYTISTHGVKAV